MAKPPTRTAYMLQCSTVRFVEGAFAMIRMLVIITAVLGVLWLPSEAARLDHHGHAAHIEISPQVHDLLPRDRYSAIALR